MLTFAVITVAPPTKPDLEAAILRLYESGSFQVNPGVWLVADNGVTAQEVSIKLGVKEGGINGVVVIQIASYFGFASKNIWEWLNTKTSTP